MSDRQTDQKKENNSQPNEYIIYKILTFRRELLFCFSFFPLSYRNSINEGVIPDVAEYKRIADRPESYRTEKRDDDETTSRGDNAN